jgi:hypothetical protein
MPEVMDEILLELNSTSNEPGPTAASLGKVIARARARARSLQEMRSRVHEVRPTTGTTAIHATEHNPASRPVDSRETEVSLVIDAIRRLAMQPPASEFIQGVRVQDLEILAELPRALDWLTDLTCELDSRRATQRVLVGVR